MHKTIKKVLVGLTTGATLLSSIPVALAIDVDTNFIRSQAGGAAPIIKVKWEMNPTRDSGGYLGSDDHGNPGAQFMPSGQYQVDKTIVICGIATDPDGVSDIKDVYADVYYPNVDLGEHHEASRRGCMDPVGDEIRLTKLSKADGINLFCDRIRNKNNNLPAWYNTDIYDYNEICNPDGELEKETAYVYCGEKEISYEDPSGDYRVLVFAQDKAGVDSNYLENYFKYLELTAFETDFDAVNYGNVKLNTHKIINGDLTWNDKNDRATNLPTVRNIGNTRVQMSVYQDDMGLGTTNGVYNVRWDARVGSSASFINYWPFTTTWLMDELDLSEKDEMDFSIEVFKFPPNIEDKFVGSMTLGARKRAHLSCI